MKCAEYRRVLLQKPWSKEATADFENILTACYI